MMGYKSLYKLHYQLPSSEEYAKAYSARYHSPFARHLGLELHPYNRRQSFEMFYTVPEDLLLLQDKILFKYKNLITLIHEIPNAGIEQFLLSKMADEIKSSNDIEGVRSTRKEIQEAIDAPPEQRSKYRLGSIVNKYTHIILNEDIKISHSYDLRKLYDDIMSDEISREDGNNLPDGDIFRRGPVSVVSETQKIIHQGVTPETRIIEYMDRAIDILNSKDMPLFTRLAIFHYLFGYVHPFYDGNGRMARFVTSLYLAKEFHTLVALQLSANIKKNRREYYRLFSVVESEFNSGDLTPFILGTYVFISGAIDSIIDELRTKLKRYNRLAAIIEASDDLKLLTNNRTTAEVLDMLLQAAIFSDIGATYKEITNSAGIAENTLRAHLKRIPEKYIDYRRDSRMLRIKMNLKVLENGDTCD